MLCMAHDDVLGHHQQYCGSLAYISHRDATEDVEYASATTSPAAMSTFTNQVDFCGESTETNPACVDPERLKEMALFLDSTDEVIEQARSVLTKMLMNNSAVVDSVNALIVVSAFIAGVQAQLISLTWAGSPPNEDFSRRTWLNLTANLLAFLGLTFGVVGTSTGVLHAIIIQRAIRHAKGRIEEIASTIRLREKLRETLRALSKGTPVDARTRRRIRAQLHEHFDAHLAAMWDVYGLSVWQRLVQAGSRLSAPIEYVFMLVDWALGPGQLPSLVMFAGIICLLGSVLCFAADTQARGVWIVCLAVSGGTALLAMVTAVAFVVNFVIRDLHRKQVRASNMKLIDQSFFSIAKGHEHEAHSGE